MICISHLLPDEEMKELVAATGVGVESIDFSISDNLDHLEKTIESYQKKLEEMERLQAENEYLRAENAVLKKLRELRLREEKEQEEKRKLSEDW